MRKLKTLVISLITKEDRTRYHKIRREINDKSDSIKIPKIRSRKLVWALAKGKSSLIPFLRDTPTTTNRVLKILQTIA